MTLKIRKPTPSQRIRVDLNLKSVVTTSQPDEGLITLLSKKSGRDNRGHVSVRHQGGRQKRYYRQIDFKRDKKLPAKVISLEYDPNRTSLIALLQYTDGEKRYILAPEGLKLHDQVAAGENVEIKIGNALPLSQIPVGSEIHNLELTPGKGGQLVRSAGASATIQAREGDFVIVKFPSGETRRFVPHCYATIGHVSNTDWKNRKIGRAGRKILMGIRPTVRGVAQHPDSHPHGGGEGRSGIGMKSPKTPWGKKALGKKTRNRRKYSNRFIIKRRKI